MNARDLWLRLRALVLRERVDQELDDELDFHLEMAARAHMAGGMPEAEARRRARIRLGARAVIEEQCRDARGIGVVETLWQDVRYALRSFRRTPLFAATVIGTIAVGLGLNAAVFTLFNAYVLRPAPVRDPYSLYAFTWRTRDGRFHAFTRAEFDQFNQHNLVFSEVFASRKQLIARIDGRPAYGTLVSDEYFQMLGVGAALGRTLTPEDARDPARNAVVVLSHAYWTGTFAADPHIIGKTMVVRGHPCEIVGVLQDGFAGLDLLPHDFWAPLALAPQLGDGSNWLEIVGRLKSDVTLRSAEGALLAWAHSMTADRRGEEMAVSVLLESRATVVPRSPLTLALFGPILAAFALVMLIACANVANMMLARSMARQREIGIRLSLGAARSRIVRQLVTESALLALPAGLAAFLISQAAVDSGMRVLLATMPAEYAEYMRLAPLAPDWRVFTFMIAAATTATVLFGLVPALEVTRPSLVRAARGEFIYDVRGARPRHALVVMQITASACLLICALLLLRAANRFATVDTGLNTRNVIEIYVRETARPRVLRALEAMPGIAAVGAVSSVPLDATAPGIAIAAGGESLLVNAAYRFATPEFFAVFEIPLVSGRHFTPQEAAAGAPVAIISQTAARRLSLNGDALGKSLRLAHADRAGPVSRLRDGTGEDNTRGHASITRYAMLEVVGIARDIGTGLKDRDSDRTAIYLPASARDAGTVLLVRATGDVERARRNLDETLSAASPGAVDRIHKMEALEIGRVFPFRVASSVSAAIGTIALLLTISGIYALLSYVVRQRAKEIGIRMALGATARAVTVLVMKQSLTLAFAGVVIGSLMALAASQLFAARLALIRSGTLDGVAYLAGAAIVLAACVAAACVPASRAARIDPIETLRQD